MNQLITITFLFVISFSIGFSQTPAVLKINNKVQVTFPDLYKENNICNTTVYKLKLADSTATLSAIAQDLSASGLTAEMLAQQIKTDKFWKDYIQGYTGQLPNFKFVDYDKMTVSGIPAVIIDLKSKEKPDTLHQLNLIVGTTNYVFSFASREGKGNKKVKELFFKSIQIIP